MTFRSLKYAFISLVLLGGCSMVKVAGLPHVSLPSGSAAAGPSSRAGSASARQATSAQGASGSTASAAPASAGNAPPSSVAAWRTPKKDWHGWGAYDPAEDCQNAWNAGETRFMAIQDLDAGASQKRIDEEVAALSKWHARATACLSDPGIKDNAHVYQALQNQVPGLKKRYAKSLERLKDLDMARTFQKEGNDIENAIQKDDGSHAAALAARDKDFVARYRKAAQTNPLMSPGGIGTYLSQHVSETAILFKNLAVKYAANNKATYYKKMLVNSVVGQDKTMRPDDSLNPGKVAAAFLKAKPGQLVQVLSDGALYSPGRVPRLFHADGGGPTRPVVTYPSMDNEQLGTAYTGYSPSLGAGTVGLIWDDKYVTVNDDPYAVFVTPDGGRYVIAYSRLAPLRRKDAVVLSKAVNTGVMADDILELGELGVLPKRYGRTMEKTAAKHHACGERVWDKAGPRFDAIRQENLFPQVRQARIEALRGKVREAVERRCKRYKVVYERAFKAANRAYAKLRIKAFARTRARMQTLMASGPQAQR